MSVRNHGNYPEGSYGYQVWELHYRIIDLVNELPLPLRTLIVQWWRLWSWYRRVTGIERRERKRELDEMWELIQKAWDNVLSGIKGEG